MEELYSLPAVFYVAVEGNGAKGRPLKAPGETEPVIPTATSVLVPMVGFDVLDCPLDEKYVFRSEIAARVLNQPIRNRVTPESIARLIAELIRKGPESARIIPFINKVDSAGKMAGARNLAGEDGGQIFRFDKLSIFCSISPNCLCIFLSP